MCKERYVSYDIAKLLKEKGFNWKCNHYYMENISGDEHYLLPGSIMYSEDYNKRIKLNELGVNINTSSGKISAPTQQMAISWFWEEKGLNINAIYGDYPSLKKAFWMPQIDSFDGCHGVDDEDFFREYDSREDCIEAALEYASKNLI